MKAGDHIICCRSMFGGTNTVVIKFLNKFGIAHTMVETTNLSIGMKRCDPTQKMLYLETPTNPQLEITDLEAAGLFVKT